MKTNTVTKAPTATQKAEVASRKKVYKVCRLGTRDGIYSALAGKYGKSDEFTRLSFKTGFVTADVVGGNGVWIYLDHDYAVDQATRMAKRYPGVKLTIFEAKPLGPITIPAGKSKTATCPAVILGDRDATVKVFAPEPVWKDVTAECEIIIRSDYGVLQHNDLDLAYLSPTRSGLAALPAGYKVERTTSHSISDGFKVLKKTS